MNIKCKTSTNKPIKSHRIIAIVKLIESGGRIYAKALANINNEHLQNSLFDIYTVKKCALLKLKPLRSDVKKQQVNSASQPLAATGEYGLETAMTTLKSDDHYLKQLVGVESKIIADIDSLLTKEPQLASKVRNRLSVVKAEMENCRERVKSMRLSI